MNNSLYENGFIQNLKDMFGFFKFRKDMKREIKDDMSLFNRYDMKLNWFGNIVYYQLNCLDEDFMNFNFDTERMVMTKIRPIVDYIGNKLGWGDGVSIQISQFVDNDGKDTLSFGILFIYTGTVENLGKFSFSFIGGVLLLLIGIITLLFIC